MGVFERADHIDRNPLNNLDSNLRLANDCQNSQNVALTKRNTSGFKGVSWDKKRSKWRVQLCHNREYVYVGHYEDIEEAAKAYDAKAKELYKEFAYTNIRTF